MKREFNPWSPDRLAGLFLASVLALASLHAQSDTDPKPATDPAPAKAESDEKSDDKAEPPSTVVGGATHDDVVRVGSDAVVKVGDRVPEVVVVFGDAKIDGEVLDNLVVVGGDLKLNGRVGGNAVVVLGDATLGPKANVGGNQVVVLGTMQKNPAAKIGGQQVHLSLGSLPQWFKRGFLLGRPFPPGIPWVWVVAGMHFLVYLILAVLLGRPVALCTEVLDARPVQAFGVGLLGWILAAPLLVILAPTVVGIVLVPFALIAGLLIGKTAVFRYAGAHVIHGFSPSATPRPLVAFILGSALISLLYMVPFLGFVVWGLLLPLGLGAALLAAFASFRKAPKADSRAAEAGAPVMVGSPGAAAQARTVRDPLLPLDPAGTPLLDLPGAEAVAMPRVGFWMRTLAALLDLVLLSWLAPFSHHFFLLFWLAYHVGMWTWKGTTIGGIVLGIKVVRLDGRPVDFSVALVRGLSAIFSFVPLLLGFFWAGWSADRQAWHDKIAGTVIVKVPKGMSLI